jgi:hypothetical protein
MKSVYAGANASRLGDLQPARPSCARRVVPGCESKPQRFGCEGHLAACPQGVSEVEPGGKRGVVSGAASSGAEREAYLKTAIDAHGDTWYGDGVQVGALARAQLAAYYAAAGRMTEAKALANEIMERFPGAVDHGGRPLAAMLQNMKLL